MTVVYPVTCLNSVISSRRLFVDSLEFSSTPSCHLQIETILFLVCMPFISFSCLVALASTLSTMFDSTGESGHPCLVLGLRGKAFIHFYNFTLSFSRQKSNQVLFSSLLLAVKYFSSLSGF